MLTPYFGFLPGAPGSLPVWAALHDYVEFFGGLFLAIGLLTRPASLALLGSMLAAVYFHLASTGLQGFPLGHVESYSYFEEPALYAAIFLFFSLSWAPARCPSTIKSTKSSWRGWTRSETRSESRTASAERASLCYRVRLKLIGRGGGDRRAGTYVV